MFEPFGGFLVFRHRAHSSEVEFRLTRKPECKAGRGTRLVGR